MLCFLLGSGILVMKVFGLRIKVLMLIRVELIEVDYMVVRSIFFFMVI